MSASGEDVEERASLRVPTLAGALLVFAGALTGLAAYGLAPEQLLRASVVLVIGLAIAGWAYAAVVESLRGLSQLTTNLETISHVVAGASSPQTLERESPSSGGRGLSAPPSAGREGSRVDESPAAGPEGPNLCVEHAALEQRILALRQLLGSSLEREQRAREDAEAADREKAEFLTAVSHELRTPLNAILGFSDVLLEEIDGPLSTSQREDLNHVRDSGQHLSALFEDVIDLSAAASTQLDLELRAVDVAALLNQIAAELGASRRKRNVEILVEVSPTLPVIRADPTRLRQVITNLAHNALKFTPRGSVSLVAQVVGEEHVLQVADTGLGIPAERLDDIFRDYARVERKGHEEGAGLGLAIVRTLVELHGGEVSVRSRVGEGSTFELRLPSGGPRGGR